MYIKIEKMFQNEKLPLVPTNITYFSLRELIKIFELNIDELIPVSYIEKSQGHSNTKIYDDKKTFTIIVEDDSDTK